MCVMVAPIDNGDQRLMIGYGHKWCTKEVKFGLLAGPLEGQKFQFTHCIVEFGLRNVS